MSTASVTAAPSGSSVTASPFAITTTFTAPTQCDQSIGGLTMMENKAYQIWLNDPEPVPGTTITSCYASQFISSYLLQQGGISQAALSPLVCPQGYTTQGPYTANYIACCPSGWDGIALYSNAPSDRPAFSGTCYTNIYNVPVKVTVYDDSSIQASSIFTATDSLAQAYALPYEGFGFGVVNLKSTTATTTPAQTGSFSTSTSSPQTSTASPSSHKISNGGIAGAVIGSILGFILLLGAFLLFLRYRRTRRVQGDPYNTSNTSEWRQDNKYPPSQGPSRFPGSDTATTSGTLTEFYQPPMQEMDADKRKTTLHEMYAGPQSPELDSNSKMGLDRYKELPDTPATPASPGSGSVVSPRSA